MKHTECKDCKLRNGDCGHHFKMDGKINYDIPRLSSCDRYGNCEFFQQKERQQGEYKIACNVLLSLEQIVKGSEGWEDSAVEAVHNAVQTAIKCMSWIPIKTRPLTEEEKQNAIEKHDVDPDDLEYPFAWHFDCKLPELKEGEQSVDVLVTTDLGFVKVTNFFIDYLGCSCFEEMDEAGEFVAWMPLPEAYKSEVKKDD